MEQHSDDGSLAFLGIEPDPSNKHFNCPETTQQKLINLSFWVVDFLDDLKIEVKNNWQIFPVASRGIDFVGYVFFHTHTRMRKSIKKNFCGAVAKLNKKENISDSDYKQRISSWLGWAKYSNSRHLLKSIIKSEIYGNL